MGEGSGKKIGPCFKCRQMGHVKANCHQLGKGGGGKPSGDGKGKDIICVTFEVLLSDGEDNAWWLDSGASKHVAMSRAVFSEFKEMKTGEHRIYMGNNSYCDVLGTGTIQIQLKGGNNLILTDVLCAPNMRKNLISVPQLDKKGFGTRFVSGKVTVGRKKNILFIGTLCNGLYQLDCFSGVANKISFEYLACLSVNDSLMWHLRLGHINIIKLR